ncbi:hypothetical protein [Streptomyces sp. NPDC002133]|uniref:hypothetical protein n=1 Tax=Streptomyces sp. NPDC002133 TaxID=3154409 RepID=UPI003329FACA
MRNHEPVRPTCGQARPGQGAHLPAARAAEDGTLGFAAAVSLQSAVPWRTFRWYKGQKDYSGVYWAAMVRARAIHAGDAEEDWTDLLPDVRALADRLVAAIEESAARRSR